MLLRSRVVRTIEPELLMPNSTPARSSGSSGVPRSANVASAASIWPLLETTMNGRPGPTGIGWLEAGSNELMVTSCTRSLPLPV